MPKRQFNLRVPHQRLRQGRTGRVGGAEAHATPQAEQCEMRPQLRLWTNGNTTLGAQEGLQSLPDRPAGQRRDPCGGPTQCPVSAMSGCSVAAPSRVAPSSSGPCDSRCLPLREARQQPSFPSLQEPSGWPMYMQERPVELVPGQPMCCPQGLSETERTPHLRLR